MGTSAGVGHSFRKNPAEAGKEAAIEALRDGGIERPDFVLVFATVGYNQRLLIGAIRDATSGAPLSGCSGEGIISRNVVAETNFGVVVLAIASDEIRFANAFVEDLPDGYEEAGRRLAKEVRPLVQPDSFACLLFIDGLTIDFDPFRQAFEDALASPLPLFGGLSADNWATRRTFQYHDDLVLTEAASCVVMSGKGNVAWGINHGCVPVGTRRTVTRSSGNVIYQIDGIPALQALEEYVENGSHSQWNKISLNLCLGFKTPDHLRKEYGEFIIRYISDKSDSEGWVEIQSDVKEGTPLWIMRRDKELMQAGLRTITRQIHEGIGTVRPKLVMQFECMGRGQVVYREQEKSDLLAFLQGEIGTDIPWIGFYTYGEIGPVSGFNCMHNFTSVVLAIY